MSTLDETKFTLAARVKYAVDKVKQIRHEEKNANVNVNVNVNVNFKSDGKIDQVVNDKHDLDYYEKKYAGWFDSLIVRATVKAAKGSTIIEFPERFPLTQVQGYKDENDEWIIEYAFENTNCSTVEKLLEKYGFNNDNTFWMVKNDSVVIEIAL